MTTTNRRSRVSDFTVRELIEMSLILGDVDDYCPYGLSSATETELQSMVDAYLAVSA